MEKPWKTMKNPMDFPQISSTKLTKAPILDAPSRGAEAEALRRCEDMAEAQSEAKMEMDNMFGSWARKKRADRYTINTMETSRGQLE